MRKYMMAAIALLIAVPAWASTHTASDSATVSLEVQAYATVTLGSLGGIVMDVDGTPASMYAYKKTNGAIQWQSNAAGTVTLTGTSLAGPGPSLAFAGVVGPVIEADIPTAVALPAMKTWTALIKDDGNDSWSSSQPVVADQSVSWAVAVAARGHDTWYLQDAGQYSGTLTATITVSAP